MRSLRILFLTPTFPPPFYGGQEAHALGLAKALQTRGVEVSVLTKRPSPAHVLRETLDGVPVDRLRPTGELKALGWRGVVPAVLFLLNAIYRLMSGSARYDLVLVSGINVLPLAAAAACLVTRKPYVIRVESPLEIREPIGRESAAKMGLSANAWMLRLARACQRAGTRRVARVVAISTEIRDALQHAGIPPDRIIAIPNGIDTDRFAPLSAQRRNDLRRRLGIGSQEQLVVYTGRLAHSKGVMMLMNVWQAISADYPQARLALVGTGEGSVDSCEAELRAMLTQGLCPTVMLTGAVDNVHEWLQAADVFAFPSESEGFGLSILEAMSVGVPMVCTRVGVAAELPPSPPCALLVAPADAAGFGEALRRLLESAELRETLSGRARNLVQGRFSMDAIAEQYVRLGAQLAKINADSTSAPLARGG